MSLKLYQIQDFFHISYKFSCGNEHNLQRLELTVSNPIKLSIFKIPPPYTQKELSRGVWKPVIRFELKYNNDYPWLSIEKFFDTKKDYLILFQDETAMLLTEINYNPQYLIHKEELEIIINSLHLHFPRRFQYAFERAHGKELVDYLGKSISSLESLAREQEQIYFHLDNQK